MSSLEHLRHRISSTQELESIVRVMKSLSAASINQYEAAARRLDSYQDVVDQALQVVLAASGVPPDQPQALTRHAVVIVMGSDRGLCGRFNEIVAAAAHRVVGELAASHEEVLVLAVGTRGAARLEVEGHPPDCIFPQPGSVSGLSQTAETILLQLDTWQRQHDLDRAVVVYNAETERKGISEVRNETLLPLDPADLARLAARPWPSRTLPVFDGEPAAVLATLLRERLFIALMRAGACSLASEHATRLAAMQAADRNIADKLDELEGDFRRLRQETITDEMMDIVTAYKSMQPARRNNAPGSAALSPDGGEPGIR